MGGWKGDLWRLYDLENTVKGVGGQGGGGRGLDYGGGRRCKGDSSLVWRWIEIGKMKMARVMDVKVG